ncbi:MAG: Rid family detoxifying hydrolase [Candidatus Nanohaloarchaea archaeon]|nr:Rid family detoxifying hydrolase [Candidatus Nanohaloarchaea archaeon]
MPVEEIQTEDAPEAIGSYSQAVRHGNMIEVSGQVGMTPDGELVDGIEAQTRQALDNLETILEAAGTDWANVLKTRIYMDDINHFEVVDRVYSEFIDKPAPARIAIAAEALPAGASVEIEVTAKIEH